MFASRSAMLSLSSAKAGSRDSSGRAEEWEEVRGVEFEARREVREGGRRGVVGREGGLLRVREAERWAGVSIVMAVCRLEETRSGVSMMFGVYCCVADAVVCLYVCMFVCMYVCM